MGAGDGAAFWVTAGSFAKAYLPYSRLPRE